MRGRSLLPTQTDLCMCGHLCARSLSTLRFPLTILSTHGQAREDNPEWMPNTSQRGRVKAPKATTTLALVMLCVLM